LFCACSAASTETYSVPEAGLDSGSAILIDANGADAPDGFVLCLVNGKPVEVGPNDDFDQDGFSTSDGDCNDCDPNTNPGAFDVEANNVDEDCNAVVDDATECDETLGISDNDPENGARAIGICQKAVESSAYKTNLRWGLLKANYQLVDGSSTMSYVQHGILPNFGEAVHPQQGQRLLALSSATARRPGDPAYQAPLDGLIGTSCATPDGWPKQSPSCPSPPASAPIANDSAALALKIRVPTNAHGLSFRFRFFTTEFPSWICHQYNDVFVSLLNTSALPPDTNISFDSANNPISVNTVFLDTCTPRVDNGKDYPCSLGPSALSGNGFGPCDEEPLGYGATGWLQSSSPVSPGETIDLLFAIWDSGDKLMGSTVVIDDFRWQADPGTMPVTITVDNPK